MILYIYSLELSIGDNAPLYAEVNRVQRDMDISLLKELGPYILTLNYILALVEENRSNKIIPGNI